MKKLSLFGYLLVGGIFALASCTKTGPEGPPGSTGPALTGYITGHIDLYDEYGGQQYGNASAAKVYLYKANSATPFDSTNPDSAGVYALTNIITGTYTMLFTAPGYGPVVHNPAGFVGGGTVNVDARMSQTPDFYVSAVAADSIDHATSVLVINCTLSSIAPTKERELLLFMGNSSIVSDTPSYYLSVYPVTVAANSSNVIIKIPLTTIYNSILTSGTIPYFAIYAANNNYNIASEYEDLNTGKIVYTAISSAVFKTSPNEPLP